MTFGISAIAAATIGAGVLGAGASIYGSTQAANAQKDAAQQSAAAQQAAYDKQVALQEPFRQGGLTAQNQLMTLLGLSPASGSGLTVNSSDPNFGKYAGDFSMADYQADPGYAFRLEQGMKGLQNSAAAKGLLSSGSTMKGVIDYNSGMASQEYGNAYNRYQTNRANQLNPLQSLMGAGQSSANTLTNAAGSLGQGLGQAAAATGSANASAYMGSTNALNNALSGGLNSYMNYNNMQTYLNNGGNPVNVGSATSYVK